MLVTVYIILKVWYNSIVKRLAVITTSLLLTCISFGSASAVSAEESETIYPDKNGFVKTLTFSNLRDYEIDGDKYYFADGETLYCYEKGKLAYPEEIEFTPAQTAVTIGNYTYNLTGTTLKVADFEGSEIQPFEGEYSNLKQFGNKAYAVKDNVLYGFEGAQQPDAICLEYFDYSVTEKINVGQTADALKNYESLTFVTVKEGAVMTAVDLTSLESEYFTLENTEEGVDVSVNTISLEEPKTALLLCYMGNAALISIGDSSYVMKNETEYLEETVAECRKEPEFANATIIGNRIYASPFTVIGNTLLPNATGTIVKVKSKIEYAGVLNSAYYEVEYKTDGGEFKTGYVAAGFLTEYIIEDNKEPTEVPDPEHSEKTQVTTVLLILAVVVLVLLALGYVVYTTTSSRKKKGKKEKNTEENEDGKKD